MYVLGCMRRLPKLAIVGRPNVGKSALFNKVCKQKIAIVDEAEGITRDRLYAPAELFGFPFEVIDTGGITSDSQLPFNEEVRRQAEIAIEEADTLIQVVDGQLGVTQLDLDVARILHRTQKPVCLAINKIDHTSQINRMHDFYSLGISRMIPVSASQGWHIAELLEAAFESFARETETTEESCPEALKIAIVGRPNVGKSSLINYLLDEERCIVSPIPGTTRDSVDIPFTPKEHPDCPCLLIDTAGIRRKKGEKEVVDKFAAIRTERAIERADLCILMLDAQEGLTTQEKRIATHIEEAGKGCLILFNKWDLMHGVRMEHCLMEIEREVPFLRHCPKLFISAKTGRNIDKIFDELKTIDHWFKHRVPTHQLNKLVESAMQKNHPPMVQGKRLRIYYMAQVSTQPPKIILFVNSPHLITETYRKYLYNQIRETYPFTGVPLLLHLKGKQPRERKPAPSAKEHQHFTRAHPSEQHDDDDVHLESEDTEDFVDFEWGE